MMSPQEWTQKLVEVIAHASTQLPPDVVEALKRGRDTEVEGLLADIDVLLSVLRRLVGRGYSLIVIEHNLELVRWADWIIDLGPDGGEDGGYVVASGTPALVAASAASHTGRFLRELLEAPATG